MEYKYLSIKKDIIKCINDNIFKSDEKLPSQLQLQEKYNASRITIIRVLKELEKEEFIYSKPNKKGMFIKSLFENINKYILVILGDITSHYDSNLLKGIEDQLHINGYKTIICNSNRNSIKVEEFIQSQDFSSIDGVIYIPAIENKFEKNNKKILEYFIKNNINYVLIDQNVASINSNIVTTDHKLCSYNITNIMLNKGLTKVLIGSGVYCYSIQERIQGIVNAYNINDKKFNYSQIITINDSNYPIDETHNSKEFEELKKQLIAFGKIDAFYALNNRILNIFLKAMLSLNIDVSNIKLFLHNELNKPVDPYTNSICYVDPHLTKMGRESVSLLIDNINKNNDDVFITKIIKSTIHER
ncbi:MAG: GntR family transcriptional regulator [Pleomorphochaeta sp.]